MSSIISSKSGYGIFFQMKGIFFYALSLSSPCVLSLSPSSLTTDLRAKIFISSSQLEETTILIHEERTGAVVVCIVCVCLCVCFPPEDKALW